MAASGPRAHRDAPLDIVSGVFMLARELRREIGELMAGERWAVEAGFRPPCLGVMSVVAHLGPVSQREISDQLGVDASDVVGVLDILESAGLVERHRDPADRRRHAVVLTAAGRRAADRVQEMRVEVVDRVLAGLDHGQRRQLAGLLERALGDRASGDRASGDRHAASA